jgi:hypothetical protein
MLAMGLRGTMKRGESSDIAFSLLSAKEGASQYSDGEYIRPAAPGALRGVVEVALGPARARPRRLRQLILANATFPIGQALSCKGRSVSDYAFKIGQMVDYKTQVRYSAAHGPYQVIQRMPVSEDGEFRYRIKSPSETHERIAKESELSRA